MKAIFSIFLMVALSGLALSGQAPEKRFVGNCSFSGFALLSDSTYRGDIVNFTDRFGDGYNLNQLAAGYEILDGRGLVFEVDTIHSATNFTADVSVTAKVDRGFAPFGSGQAYSPTENGLIPPSSQEQAGLSPTQKARVDRHNVVVMQSLIGGRDSVYSIASVPDTSGLSPVLGDAFVNATADTLGLYDGAGWVLFFGGSQSADGFTILGDGTGGDPFRADTVLMATRHYADSLFNAADSLRELGDKSAPILIPVFDRITQLNNCATSLTVNTGFILIDDTAINEGDIVFEINASPATITYDLYNEDSTAYYFEEATPRTANTYFWEVGYTDADGNFVGDLNSFDVIAGRPDTVTAWTSDTTTVTRICGTVLRRDTISTYVTDGDKGDIIVSGSGATWTIDTVGRKLYFAAGGQSNMFGQYNGGNMASDGRVRLARNDGTTIAWNPTGRNNPAFQFGKEWVRNHPLDTLVFFFVAEDSTSISLWYPSSGRLRDSLDLKMAAHGNPDIEGFLWHQGEQDGYAVSGGINSGSAGSLADSNYYQKWRDSLYVPLVGLSNFGSDTRFVVGTVSDLPSSVWHGVTVNAALRYIGRDKYENTGCADGWYLPTADSLHFTGASIDTFGVMYYNCFNQLPYNYEKNDTSEIELVLDSAYGVYYYELHADDYAYNDTLFFNWSTDFIRDTVRTVPNEPAFRMKASALDSTMWGSAILIGTEFPVRDNPHANWGFRASFWSPAGDIGTGLMVQTHKAATQANGYFLTRRTDNRVEIYRVSNGAATSVLNVVKTNVWPDSTWVTLEAEITGDSVIVFSKVLETGAKVPLWIGNIALANRFPGKRGASVFTYNTYFPYVDDVYVWNADLYPFTVPPATAVTFSNAGTVDFSFVGPNIMKADVRAAPATEITYSSAGNFSSVTGQDAITEAYTDAIAYADANDDAGTDDQTASEVPFTPFATIVATQTQAAIEELYGDLTSLDTHIGNSNLAADANRELDMDGNQLAITNAEVVTLGADDGGASANKTTMTLDGISTSGMNVALTTSAGDAFLSATGEALLYGDAGLDSLLAIKFDPQAQYFRFGHYGFQASSEPADGTMLRWNATSNLWQPVAPYQSSTGSPVSAVTPAFIGQEYLDTAGPAWWKAHGLTNSDWTQITN